MSEEREAYPASAGDPYQQKMKGELDPKLSMSIDMTFRQVHDALDHLYRLLIVVAHENKTTSEEEDTVPGQTLEMGDV